MKTSPDNKNTLCPQCPYCGSIEIDLGDDCINKEYPTTGEQINLCAKCDSLFYSHFVIHRTYANFKIGDE